MELRFVRNTSGTPVVTDDEGRQLGSGGWGHADIEVESVDAAVQRGALVFPAPPPEDSENTEAVDAYRAYLAAVDEAAARAADQTEKPVRRAPQRRIR